MYEDYKVVVVTPAGRKRYLELLIPQIAAFRPIVDEYHLWANTIDRDDMYYMYEMEDKYDGFLKVIPLSVPYAQSDSIYSFFKTCVEEKTIYVRFDDDIVLVDNIEAFKGFLKFRIENPNHFMVFANILNNAAITHIHQRLGNFSGKAGFSGYKCLDKLGWERPSFALNLHREVLEKGIDHFRLPFNWKLFDFERVSINCVSWLGEGMAKVNGNITHDEEEDISVVKPKLLNMPNIVFGGFLCVHYAFVLQRGLIDKTDVLARYKEIVENKLNISI
jgi:hypothetical protein